MQVIKPKEVIEEIYNLRTGEKYKNDEDVRVIMPSLDLFGETK
jgi:hypothetical protein